MERDRSLASLCFSGQLVVCMFVAVCVCGRGEVACSTALKKIILYWRQALYYNGCPHGGRSRTCVEGDRRAWAGQLHSLPSARNHTSSELCLGATPLLLAVTSCLPSTRRKGNLPWAIQDGERAEWQHFFPQPWFLFVTPGPPHPWPASLPVHSIYFSICC